MKIGAIIQARMGSTRLSGKVMKELQGKTVLEHVIKRVSQSRLINEIIIATTYLERDDIIENKGIENKVIVFRGSEDDVLSRYYYAAKEHNLDVVVRVTSDCPLFDVHICDEVIEFFLTNKYDIVANASNDPKQRTYPRGLDVEVISFSSLKNAYNNAEKLYQREHVTPYIYENSERVYFYKNSVDYSKHRWTLDTQDDYELISIIYNRLYKGKHDFYLSDIIKLLEDEPELLKINSHIEQKKYHRSDK